MAASLSSLADTYGITKVTAKNRLIALNLFDEHAHKEGRAFVIDDYAVEEFAKHYAPVERVACGSGDAVAPAAVSVSNDQLIDELRDMVEYLKAQLAQKDDLAAKQLAEKDEQIARRDEQISQLIAK